MQVIVNDLVVSYTRAGEGPILVIVPDIASTVDALNELVDELVNTMSVVVVHPPSMGGSQMPKKTWDCKKLAIHLSEALQKMAIMQNDVTILCGYGTGGKVALTAVAMGLIRPKKLVLLCTDGRSIGRKRLFGLLGARSSVHDAQQTVFFDEWQRKTYKKLQYRDVFSYAENTDVTALVLHAELDQLVPLLASQTMANTLHNSHLKIIPHAQHDLSGNFHDVASYIASFSRSA